VCGRYSLATEQERLLRRFGLPVPAGLHRPRYNIAPGQRAPVIASGARPAWESPWWGLVPSRFPEAKPLINARAETLSLKPSFRDALRARRCLVPADGFYEWRAEGNPERLPTRVTLKGRDAFAFAGLWEEGRSPSGEPRRTFAIVTTEARGPLKEVHSRMPVILREEDEAAWLDARLAEPSRLLPLLRGRPVEELESFEVSPFVNAASAEGPECLRPAPPARQPELWPPAK
jgi:putative SOS response-associated peptidase YedK